MAELNFGLLTPPGSQSIGNAFVTGMDQAAAARAQENQNALSQYTLRKARREDEMQNQLYDAVRQPGFVLDIGTAMRFGAPGLAAYKAQQESNKNAVDIAYTKARTGAIPGEEAYRTEQTAKLSREAQVEREKYAWEKLSRLALNPGGATDDDVRTAISDAVSSGNLSMADATRAQTALLNTPIEKRSENLALMAGNAGDRIKALMPDMQLVTKPDGSMGWVNKAPMSPGFGGNQGLPGYAAGMTPYQTGSLGVSQGNLAVNRARAMDEGTPIPGAAAPTNAMFGAQPAAAPTNAMVGAQQTAAPTTSGLSPAATRRVAEAKAKAQIPTYNKDAGGFITPPTASNPNGTFVPLVAVQTAKDVTANRKALNLSGYDHTTGKDEIAALIDKSTGGVLQAGAAGTLGAFNYTTEGADAISRLGTRVKAMTLSLLEGKLGAGISNADRDFIEGLFGDIANPNIASGKRLAAWNEAKKRMLSLGMLDSPDQPRPAAAATPTPKAAPAIGTIQNGYRFNGGDPSKINRWTKVGG